LTLRTRTVPTDGLIDIGTTLIPFAPSLTAKGGRAIVLAHTDDSYLSSIATSITSRDAPLDNARGRKLRRG
jgi:hypothetical protein